MRDSDRYTIDEGRIVSELMDGEAIIVNLANGYYYSLDRPANRGGRPLGRGAPYQVGRRAEGGRDRRRDADLRAHRDGPVGHRPGGAGGDEHPFVLQVPVGGAEVGDLGPGVGAVGGGGPVQGGSDGGGARPAGVQHPRARGDHLRLAGAGFEHVPVALVGGQRDDHGPVAVAACRGQPFDAPFVVLAEHLTMETALESLRAGATACLPKLLSDVKALSRELSRALKLTL